MMDSILCDELMISIFQRLPPPCLSSVSLVSKRWLLLSRHSTTSLSLHLSPPFSLSLSPLLLHYPFLSSLSLSSTSPPASDHLLLSAASSCPNLRRLRFLCSPVSLPSLFSLSSTLPNLSSLTLSLSRPLYLYWLPSFPSLKHLSLVLSHDFNLQTGNNWVLADRDVEFNLESFSVSGLSWDDVGMGWFWRNCRKLRKLQLRSCDGVGGSFLSFSRCLEGLIELELRSCRSIADLVLLNLAENSTELDSLLIYDGGSRDGLLHFSSNCRSKLRKVDLRLPLDLKNEHLSTMALNFSSLNSLRLQSCCLVTGDGLKALSWSLSNNLEELALINCDVVERMPGLLTSLGQNLKKLRKLDLSYNEMLGDKELVSMLVSCDRLVELNIRGCRALTSVTLMCVNRVCRNLESVDIVHCCRIGAEAVELLLSSSKRLKKVAVEENKLSEEAKTWASNRFIQVTTVL